MGRWLAGTPSHHRGSQRHARDNGQSPRGENAINLPVAQGIRDAVDEFDADKELRVAVLTGAGGTFSAGMDLKAHCSCAGQAIPPARDHGGCCTTGQRVRAMQHPP
ncbi:MAG: enoyl-CoA hydratase-related protein [Streptosporangiaceae bacterium]